MAKKELLRKILATILTVLGMVCGLAICLWLLMGSNAFGNQLRWLMIVCIAALAVAIAGLLVCKVQEIKALAEIVRFDEQRAKEVEQHGGAEGEINGAHLERQAEKPMDATPVVAPVGTGVKREPGAQGDAKGETEQEQQRHWRPINFKAVDQQAHADDAARSKALGQAASAAGLKAGAAKPAADANVTAGNQQEKGQAQPEKPAPEPKPASEPVQEQAKQNREELLRRAHQLEVERRAEQLRMAEDARVGQVRADQIEAAEKARLEELARKAEAERIAHRNAGLSTAPAPKENPSVEAGAGKRQGGRSAKNSARPWVKSSAQTTAPAFNPSTEWQEEGEQSITVSIPAVTEEDAEEPVHKLNVKPIQWPAPPPPSKMYLTGQIPAVSDEMLKKGKDAKDAPEEPSQPWKKSE